MTETKPDPRLVLPKQSINYRCCEAIKPGVEFSLGLNLVQSFVPTEHPSDDLHFQLWLRPENADPGDHRIYWPIPLTGRLSVERIKQLRGPYKLGRPSALGRRILDTDSFRVGIQEAMLAWVAPSFTVDVIYTIGVVDSDKHAAWRIECRFGNELIALWDAKNDIKQKLFETHPKRRRRAA